jgi:hypothetical protein
LAKEADPWGGRRHGGGSIGKLALQVDDALSVRGQRLLGQQQRLGEQIG